MTNALKLSALGLSMLVMAGCAANGGEMDGKMKHDQGMMKSQQTAQEAMTTAQQAQRTADRALQMAQENRQAMDRMFQKSMQK